MSLERSLTTNEDGRLCLEATLRELTYDAGYSERGQTALLVRRLLSLLWSTRRTGGRISIPWCVCVEGCVLDYSRSSGSSGSKSTGTPSSRRRATS